MEKRELKIQPELKTFLIEEDVQEIKQALLDPDHSMGDFLFNFEFPEII